MKNLYRDRRWLQKQYCQEKKTLKEIGEICDVKESCISKWMNRFSIPTRKKNKFQPKIIDWEYASYIIKHYRVKKRLELSKPLKCPICNKDKKLELSNKDHKYREDIDDWQYLCHKCHYIYDKTTINNSIKCIIRFK